MANASLWVFGGAIVISLVGLLVGQAFRSKEPTDRAVYATSLSWAICTVLTGLLMAKDGSFWLEAPLYWCPGAILALFYLGSHFRGIRRASDANQCNDD
jgi:hypothetical protein